MTGRAGSSAPRRFRQAARRRFLLIADSDAGRLFHTASILERLQYSVWTAQTAAEALEMATTALPASIVTTIHLGDMEGVELIKQIKQNERTKSVSIFVLTDKTDPIEERACLAAGAVTCLSMPFQPEDLYRMIQVAVEPMPRMNIRIQTKLSVAVNSEPVECGEEDCASMISEHGLFVRTVDPQPLDSTLSVTFRLGTATIEAEAVVVFCEASGHDPGMGLQFRRIKPEDQILIRNFIREKLTRKSSTG